jgi:plasmid stabilization system protein ParE
MTRIELAPEGFDDFDRFFEHIAQFDAGSAPQRIGDILEAIQILTHSPLIGRPVKDGKRELVIGRATRGYVALYRYVAAIDTCLCWWCGRSVRMGLSVKMGFSPVKYAQEAIKNLVN